MLKQRAATIASNVVLLIESKGFLQHSPTMACTDLIGTDLFYRFSNQCQYFCSHILHLIRQNWNRRRPGHPTADPVSQRRFVTICNLFVSVEIIAGRADFLGARNLFRRSVRPDHALENSATPFADPSSCGLKSALLLLRRCRAARISPICNRQSAREFEHTGPRRPVLRRSCGGGSCRRMRASLALQGSGENFGVPPSGAACARFWAGEEVPGHPTVGKL
jgi:hypothetical protein